MIRWQRAIQLEFTDLMKQVSQIIAVLPADGVVRFTNPRLPKRHFAHIINDVLKRHSLVHLAHQTSITEYLPPLLAPSLSILADFVAHTDKEILHTRIYWRNIGFGFQIVGAIACRYGIACTETVTGIARTKGE